MGEGEGDRPRGEVTHTEHTHTHTQCLHSHKLINEMEETNNKVYLHWVLAATVLVHCHMLGHREAEVRVLWAELVHGDARVEIETFGQQNAAAADQEQLQQQR